MIIDMHGHLGDILYPGGGELINKTGVPFPKSNALQRKYDRLLNGDSPATIAVNGLFPYIMVKSERERNFAATLENLRKSLDGTGISECVCAPIAPNCTFANMQAAEEAEPRIIAFTSPDFTLTEINETVSQIKNDLAFAAGIKIHPIIQQTEADSAHVSAVLEAVSKCPRPVLIHAGSSKYYMPREKRKKYFDCANVLKIEKQIAKFGNVPFVIGHAGLREIRTVIERLSKYKNAYVDTSFQPPSAIRALIEAFGAGRVLFASDWPYGLRPPAIAAVREACAGDELLERAVLYENAKNLLNQTAPRAF
ncbi:MAG: amidohydrolase family protein [Defluviitaleaceae bacterium]|nr:amidohydrolase family protein [Defluviitaleaceae bacterium]